VIAKKPMLMERQAAFLSTLNILLDETVQIIDQSAPIVQAALVSAAATLVVGADLTNGGIMGTVPTGEVSHIYLLSTENEESE
jgi:hypothetical protein